MNCVLAEVRLLFSLSREKFLQNFISSRDVTKTVQKQGRDENTLEDYSFMERWQTQGSFKKPYPRSDAKGI